jgi:hypothetical protein
MSEPFVREGIISRALSDAKFRAALAENTEQTLIGAGFRPTSDQVRVIQLARPAEWGSLAFEDIVVRIDTLAKKR